MHTWGGQGHASECDVTVSPDGSVEAKLGSQDLGRAHGPASALSLPKRSDCAQKRQGRDRQERIPEVRSFRRQHHHRWHLRSSRQAATAVLNELFAKVAPKLSVEPDALEARGGEIRVAGIRRKKLSWKDACAPLGVMPVTKRGVNTPGDSIKADSSARGSRVQIATWRWTSKPAL